MRWFEFGDAVKNVLYNIIMSIFVGELEKKEGGNCSKGKWQCSFCGIIMVKVFSLFAYFAQSNYKMQNYKEVSKLLNCFSWNNKNMKKDRQIFCSGST